VGLDSRVIRPGVGFCGRRPVRLATLPGQARRPASFDVGGEVLDLSPDEPDRRGSVWRPRDGPFDGVAAHLGEALAGPPALGSAPDDHGDVLGVERAWQGRFPVKATVPAEEGLARCGAVGGLIAARGGPELDGLRRAIARGWCPDAFVRRKRS